VPSLPVESLRKTRRIVFAHGHGFDKGPAIKHVPCFPRDLVNYVYEKTKRAETSNMAHGLGERPTFSAIGHQTDSTGEKTASSHKAPRSVDKQYAKELQPSTSGFSLEPATRSPAGHSSCHHLGGLLYKSPLKIRQRHPENPRHDTSP
jgi:hypothetical protein